MTYYFNVPSPNGQGDSWSWTVELDTEKNIVTVSNGASVWRNTVFLLNKQCKQRLTVSFRQSKSNIIRKNNHDGGDIEIHSTLSNDHVPLKLTTTCENDVQTMFHKLSLALSCANQRLKSIGDGTDKELQIINFPLFKKQPTKSQMRPGMSAINPHAKKRKNVGSGVLFED